MKYLKRAFWYTAALLTVVTLGAFGDTVTHPQNIFDAVSATLTVSDLTASRLVVSDSSKKLASNGALTSNTIPKSASSGATLADSAISDDGTAVTVSSNLIDSGLTASRIMVSNGSKQLVSNGALTTGVLPKSASSGASLADSTISETATVAGTTLAWQSGRHLVSGFTPTCSLSSGWANVTVAIQATSTDEAGYCVLTCTNGSCGSGGTITLTFSTGSSYGSTGTAVCSPFLAAGTGSWQSGATTIAATTSTTAPTISAINDTILGVGTALSSGSTYLIGYICYGRP